MLEKIRDTIEKYSLIEKGDGVLIGLSGGADSVCLTHMLYTLKDELGIKIYTAHMNHCIRGVDADRDEKFAVEFSNSLGINCIHEKQDVRGYAEMKGISEETAGRELRYAFFERVLKERGLNKIATAHNKNDNAETILMNFMRGSGTRGLCGIPYKRGNIVRPILSISREEIEGYCKENSLKYVTDNTNNETVYTRNKIRLDLIPKIQKEFNSGFINTVTKNSVLISEELDYIEHEADKICEKIKDNAIALDELMKNHNAIARRVIMRMIKLSGIGDISAEYIESVLKLAKHGHSGAKISLPSGKTAKIEYGRLIIDGQEENTEPFEYDVPIGESVFIKELGVTVRAEISEGENIFPGNEKSQIVIRSRKEGDIFYPVGMDGSKKLKKYFIDAKIPRNERANTGILTIDGKIAWIMGRQRDRRFIFNGRGIKINILK